MTDTNILASNWMRIMTMTHNILGHDAVLFNKYRTMLSQLKDDRIVPNRDPTKPDIALLGMVRAPASKERHHAFEGGLAAHLCEMWELWISVKTEIFRQRVRDQNTDINDSLIWRGILHHDLDKVYKYYMTTTEPWNVEYSNDYDVETAMLGETHKSLFLMGQADIIPPRELHSALIISHGGFSREQPRAQSVLAKILYLLDELSANVVDRIRTGRLQDSKIGGLDGAV